MQAPAALRACQRHVRSLPGGHAARATPSCALDASVPTCERAMAPCRTCCSSTRWQSSALCTPLSSTDMAPDPAVTSLPATCFNHLGANLNDTGSIDGLEVAEHRTSSRGSPVRSNSRALSGTSLRNACSMQQRVVQPGVARALAGPLGRPAAPSQSRPIAPKRLTRAAAYAPPAPPPVRPFWAPWVALGRRTYARSARARTARRANYIVPTSSS